MNAPTIEPDSRFGRYQVRGRLDRGYGENRVYRAFDPTRGEEVALKLMEPERGERASQEAEAMLSVEHAHVVPLYERGVCDGRPYLAVKLYAGSLGDCLEAYQAEPKRVAELMAKVAAAVAHLHKKGVVHLDIKPSNILLDRLDGGGSPSLSDFGLARRVDAAQSDASLRGTLENMAPERLQRNAKSNPELCDVFSLGTVLYELLVGRPVYEGTDHEVMRRLASAEAVPKPSERSRFVAEDLEDICLECLEKVPELRYASAQALSEDLAAVVAGKRPKVCGRSPSQRLRRQLRRRPLRSFASALVLAIVLAAAVVSLWTTRGHEQVLREQVLSANRYAAQATAGQVLLQLRSFGDRAQTCVEDARVRDAVLSHASHDELRSALRECAPKSVFDSVMLLDADAYPVLREPDGPPENMSKSYAFRDYYRGAQRLAKRLLVERALGRNEFPRENFYVSRAHTSEGDGQFKLSLSTPVFSLASGAEAPRVLGYLMTTLGTDESLASLSFRDPADVRRTGTLLSLRDRERAEASGPLPNEFRVLIHDGLRHGATAPARAPELDRFAREFAAEAPESRRQFRVSEPRQQALSDDYRDLVPGFEGRWLSGFARVGETNCVVVVQSRYESVALVTTWLWLTLGSAAAFLGACFVLFVVFKKPSR
ncbi:MAG: protein kinase [Polyangiaceae bacterium]